MLSDISSSYKVAVDIVSYTCGSVPLRVLRCAVCVLSFDWLYCIVYIYIMAVYRSCNILSTTLSFFCFAKVVIFLINLIFCDVFFDVLQCCPK